MKLILDSWQLRWRSVLFDTCTGRGKVRWFAKRSEVNNGWANKFEGTWYALWKQGDHLIFQVGEKSWNMGSCKCFHRSQGVMSVFEIHRLEEIEFSLRYVCLLYTSPSPRDA